MLEPEPVSEAACGDGLGGMGGFRASQVAPGMLGARVGTAGGSRGHPIAVWHLHSWKWFEQPL